MNYGHREVQEAIDGLASRLGCVPSRALQAEYEAGLHPNLLAYDKIESTHASNTMLTKYLVGAASFLHQPANFYNIFSTCRCVNIIQFLDRAVRQLTSSHIEGVHTRLQRLITEVKRDAFDAIAFELITAARYLEHPLVTSVKFLEETSAHKTPDFVASCGHIEIFVECKKIDRTQNYTLAVRNAARDLVNPVISWFKAESKSVLADITFHTDPQLLSARKLFRACEAALRKQVPIIDHEFTVSTKFMPPHNDDELTLFPSPKLWWDRYGYRVRSEWIGVVNQVECRMAHRSDLPANLQGGVSTWLDEMSWDAAAKWKVSSDAVIAKYRRFAFEGIFKGFEQIKSQGFNSTVHLWLESDYYTGGREATFFDLFDRIVQANQHDFGWLVINEMLMDVSPKGRFDLIEHAHMIQGPSSISRKPFVTNVFIADGSISESSGFGTGVELPDIDDET